MKLAAVLISFALAAGSAFAAEEKKEASPAQKAQQEKMKACNAKAADKKGDERKAFMKHCLSANKQATQQEKMKTCNADASTKALKGDERKAFMSDCLKKK